jgi:hypothetical protein
VLSVQTNKNEDVVLVKNEKRGLSIFVNSYEVLFGPDGRGCIDPLPSGCNKWDLFTHKLNLAELEEQFRQPKDLHNYLSGYFWQEINPKLENPILDDDYYSLEIHELEFVNGNRENFDHLMQLFILTEPDLENNQNRRQEVVVKSGAKVEPSPYSSDEDRSKFKGEPHLQKEWSYYTERLNKLVDLALQEHRPYGFHYEYNDNGSGRRSCYDLEPEELTYDPEEFYQVSARERMNAHHELSKWLISKGQNPTDFALDRWEKIR